MDAPAPDTTLVVIANGDPAADQARGRLITGAALALGVGAGAAAQSYALPKVAAVGQALVPRWAKASVRWGDGDRHRQTQAGQRVISSARQTD